MYYIAKSEELKCYIIGYTQYSQYFRSENHFKNSIIRLGIEKEKFDFFMIYSIPGEDEEFNNQIKEFDSRGFIPLNKSAKYLSLIFDITNNPNVFKALEVKFENLPKKDAEPSKKAYGQFGRVKLTDKQYKKLCDDFSVEQVNDVIPYLDEYLESTNNKNGYTNFYIVMKRAILENWYNTRAKYDKKKKEESAKPEVPEAVKNFLNEIKWGIIWTV